jgi:hypothetical protein
MLCCYYAMEYVAVYFFTQDKTIITVYTTVYLSPFQKNLERIFGTPRSENNFICCSVKKLSQENCSRKANERLLRIRTVSM